MDRHIQTSFDKKSAGRTDVGSSALSSKIGHISVSSILHRE
jgi:hypothetical protein